MSKNPRELLNAFMGGLSDVSATNGEQVTAFMNLLGAAYKPGAMDTKTKELISNFVKIYNYGKFLTFFNKSNHRSS